MIDDTARQQLHVRLIAEQERLRREIGTEAGEGLRGDVFLADEQDSVDQHPADDGSEMFEREKNLTIMRTLEIELRQVEDALRKFDAETYGICELCGKPIPEKRLRAYPAATHDVDCQSKLERQGAHRAHSA